MLSNQTPSGRNGKKGFTDYSQAYPRLGIPVSLVSCDDTGAMQLAIMRQMDYRTRIAQAAFGAGILTTEDSSYPLLRQPAIYDSFQIAPIFAVPVTRLQERRFLSNQLR